MKYTSEIHTRMEGIPVQIMERMIELGLASNKTEAIRLALLDYNEHHPIVEKFKKQKIDEEEEFYQALVRESNKSVWDNPKEDEAEKWYEEQYKKGRFYESEKE